MSSMKRILTASILAMILCLPALAGAADSPVLPPGFNIEGKTAVDLSVEWWQWTASFPSRENPVNDRTGAKCANGQQGKVWFLAGGFGSSIISRKCAVPPGTYIFFPVINLAYWQTALTRRLPAHRQK